jgi:hypothetical protein
VGASETDSSSTPYTAECKIGRLVEARLFTLRTVDQVTDFQGAMRRAFVEAGPRSIICADWRAANLLAPEVSDALVGLLRTGNSFFERSAILLSPDEAIFNMQVERVVREAASPGRRTFRDMTKLRVWLAEVLDADERRRMNEFLREY